MLKTRYVTLEDIPAKAGRTYASLQGELTRFAQSESLAMEILWEGHYKSAFIACRVWRAAIERSKYHMRAISRRNRVFIIKDNTAK